MRKFESSQKDESRSQLADSSKAYRKRRAFIVAEGSSGSNGWAQVKGEGTYSWELLLQKI